MPLRVNETPAVGVGGLTVTAGPGGDTLMIIRLRIMGRKRPVSLVPSNRSNSVFL